MAEANWEVVAAVQTDVGCRRDINEDSVCCVRPGDPDVLAAKGMLVVVADGMGGHLAGEVASRTAVEIVARVYFESGKDVKEALAAGFAEANREIHRRAAEDATLQGMGTTCCALVLCNGQAHSSHVGDSRVYLVRNGGIYQMTEDHSVVMNMVRSGLLTREQSRRHPERNVILRALGTQPEVEVSAWEHPMPVREGDTFLLCSDGLTDLVEDEEIRQTVLELEPHAACARLIELAKERGGHDNITVAVVSLRPAPARAPVQTREVKAPQ